MPTPKLTARDLEIKSWLLSGKSILATSRQLGVGKSVVYDSVTKLLNAGAIAEHCHPNGRQKSPREFYDPTIQRTLDETPKGVSKKKAEVKEAVVASDDTPGSDVRPDDTLARAANPRGVYVGNNPPETYVRAHVAGCIVLDVLSEGPYETIRSQGITFGYWTDEKPSGNGCTERSANLRLFGEEVTIRFRKTKRTGRISAMLNMGSIWIDSVEFTEDVEVKELFSERAEVVIRLMKENGWQLKSPRIVGKIHVAWKNHKLAQHLSPYYEDESADLKVDCSLGTYEVENEHPDDPFWGIKNELISNLPTHLMDMIAADAKLKKELAEARNELDVQKVVLTAVRSNIVDVTDVAATVSTLLTDMATRYAQLYRNFAELSEAQAKTMANQLEFNNSVLGAFQKPQPMDPHQRRFDDYTVAGTNPDGDNGGMYQ